MKHWLETLQVVERLGDLQASGIPAALATVVRVRGSAYRRPGAKLLVDAQGGSVGNVSGGCLEADVREVALRVIATERAELRSYCSGADPIEAWDLGLGCEGEVEVLVAPAPAPADLPALAALLAGDAPFALCSPAEEGAAGGGGWLALSAGAAFGTLGDPALDSALRARLLAAPEETGSGLWEIGGRAVFIDRFEPPPHLLIFGAGDDALPVARLADGCGFRVTVFDRRPALLEAHRFPPRVRRVHAAAAAVAEHLPTAGEMHALLMNHSFADDRACARALAALPLRYLGMLGPRARTERILSDPALSRWLEDDRLFAPVGLDTGTEGAEQVAISILAELLAVRSGRSAAPLRDRCAPIHAALG